MRGLLQEHHIHKEDLILPIFVEENATERKEIASMPGVFRETEKTLPARVKEAESAGINAIILFGVSHHKDAKGSDSLKNDGLLARMIKSAKAAAPDLLVIADTCFCEYTDHGHCGILDHTGDVDNDETLENLGAQAVIAANAGADIIAPSGMMDGMVDAIRNALDEAEHLHIPIMSYGAKFASGFYGPFRDAAGCSLSASSQGREDRKTYQMNPANAEESLREVALDLEEGADMMIVKPGMPYLDIIYRVKSEFQIPTIAYQVSGEYAMIKAMGANGGMNADQAMLESLLCFKRAGADAIITYSALDIAKTLP